MDIGSAQKEIIELYEKYNNIHKKIIKTNIKNNVTSKKIKPKELAEGTGIPLNTINKVITVHGNYKPSFMVTMIICNFLGITIEDILEQVAIPNVTAGFEWTKEQKQNFLKEYSELSLTELSEKYNIAESTAKEYARVFKSDLEIYVSKSN